jgi:hypothetical protein
MSDAPERIWAASSWKRIDQGTWWDENPGGGSEEYTRADLHAAAIEELEAKLAKAVEAAVDTAASLAAAISLLEKGGKKAAASDKMFNQMLIDYRASLQRSRAALAELKGEDRG